MKSLYRITLAVVVIGAIIFGFLILFPHIECMGKSEKYDSIRTAHHIDTLEEALVLFEERNGRYPSNQEGLEILLTDEMLGPYLTASTYLYDAWGARIKYELVNDRPRLSLQQR